MTRTTLDIEAPILEELRELQKKEGRSLGKLASELLAEGLSARKERKKKSPPEFKWISRDMGPALIDIEDKDALWAVLDSEVPAVREALERRAALPKRHS